ncbi:hypothetical protein GCM10022214_25610 [Actinomadura miaoliensis]|uniref:Uncharacterized protein n=1 Tax=Actinomadura miaoliensis TaxID=430685 RepID=A0ABP7VM31_9ACTN
MAFPASTTWCPASPICGVGTWNRWTVTCGVTTGTGTVVFFCSRARVALGVLVVAAERRRVVVAARLGLSVPLRCVVRLRVVLVSATVAMSAPGTVSA